MQTEKVELTDLLAPVSRASVTFSVACSRYDFSESGLADSEALSVNDLRPLD